MTVPFIAVQFESTIVCMTFTALNQESWCGTTVMTNSRIPFPPIRFWNARSKDSEGSRVARLRIYWTTHLNQCSLSNEVGVFLRIQRSMTEMREYRSIWRRWRRVIHVNWKRKWVRPCSTKNSLLVCTRRRFCTTIWIHWVIWRWRGNKTSSLPRKMNKCWKMMKHKKAGIEGWSGRGRPSCRRCCQRPMFRSNVPFKFLTSGWGKKTSIETWWLGRRCKLICCLGWMFIAYWRQKTVAPRWPSSLTIRLNHSLIYKFTRHLSISYLRRKNAISLWTRLKS